MYQSLPEIPSLGSSASAVSCRSIPIDLSDSRAAEPLVKFTNYGISCESFYACQDGSNWPYHEPIAGAIADVWGRSSVAEKLVGVNKFLQSYGAEILVLDGYRSIACQQGLWDFFSRQAEREMPEASPAEKLNFVRTYISDPTTFSEDDPTSWPTHSTGGAVDVLLKRVGSDERLEMGARFDEMTPVSSTDYFEGELKHERINPDDPRLLHRRLLYTAMISAGFTNFPSEFWHYDFGTQMYVLYAQAMSFSNPPHTAWYGYIKSPEAGL